MNIQSPPGLIIAAPSSNSGKSIATLSLLAAFKQTLDVQSYKVGPDYLDPMLHRSATGKACFNLDPWAMDDAALTEIINWSEGADLCIAEGVMGLFDGANGTQGSTAELAKRTGWPVVLVVDCQGLSQSIAPLLQGFKQYDPSVNVAGVIFNRVGSVRHVERLARGAAEVAVDVLGYLPRKDCFKLPRRHLGLLQADEIPGLKEQIQTCATQVLDSINLDRLRALAQPSHLSMPCVSANCASSMTSSWVPRLGQNIAIARDEAFGFCYPHWLRRWQSQGVNIEFFSPLANQAVPRAASGVFLPGGYPELHAQTLAQADVFRRSLRDCQGRIPIYGECGGFMVLGERLIDAQGQSWRMLGLLPHTTDYSQRKLHLGYRQLHAAKIDLFGGEKTIVGHEFHYSSLGGGGYKDVNVDADVVDAMGCQVTSPVLKVGTVIGSYMHMIDGKIDAE